MPRVDVTLRGLPPTNVPATVSALTVARNALVPVPVIGAGIRISATAVSRSATVPAPGVVTPSRDDLVIGVDKPTADNTGTYPGVTLIPVPGNVTLSTPGQIYENRDVQGRISITAADVTVRNCRVRGLNQAPSGDTFLISCTNTNVRRAVIEDCEIAPDFPHWNWDSGITGHDFTARRCNIHHTVDGINVYWSPPPSTPYDSSVVIEQCWIHDLAWWTAATGGVVHPTDTKTHNDGIQHQGGWGTIVRGNVFDAAYARQYGHWSATNYPTTPYTLAAIGSLGGGAPHQAIPDRGTGTEATGRYNGGSLHNFLIGNNVGTSRELVVEDNWFYNGNYGFNLGGFANTGSVELIRAHRNRFDHAQFEQGSGGNDTFTFAGAGAGWSGFIDSGAGTADANYYEDNEVEINFRGD